MEFFVSEVYSYSSTSTNSFALLFLILFKYFPRKYPAIPVIIIANKAIIIYILIHKIIYILLLILSFLLSSFPF